LEIRRLASRSFASPLFHKRICHFVFEALAQYTRVILLNINLQHPSFLLLSRLSLTILFPLWLSHNPSPTSESYSTKLAKTFFFVFFFFFFFFFFIIIIITIY
jgi:hypothetical protein